MPPVKSILVDIDATARVHPALERAVRIARGCGARLKIVDVASVPAEASGYLRADVERDVVHRLRGQLSTIASGIRGLSVDHDVLLGPPALALIKEVLRSDHDLLMRSHARDLVARGPRPFGAVARQLFRQCPCPVWAVGPGGVPQYPGVVGAVHPNGEDPTERELNARVVELASFIADLERGSVTLLHAWRPLAEIGLLNQHSSEDFPAYLYAAERRAAESLRALRDSFGRSLAAVNIDLRRGTPDQVIPEFVVAQGIDLVVLGTLARTGIAGLVIGNTAERLLHRVPCSVLAVKPRGFRSPVRLEDAE